MQSFFRLFFALEHRRPMLANTTQLSALWLAWIAVAHTLAEAMALVALPPLLVPLARLEHRGLTLLPLLQMLASPRDKGELFGGEGWWWVFAQGWSGLPNTNFLPLVTLLSTKPSFRASLIRSSAGFPSATKNDRPTTMGL